MGTRITSLANNFDSTGKLKAAGMNNASLSGITSLPSGVAGSIFLISSQTASSSSSISFTSGLDSTYNEYVFRFVNIHPSDNNALLQVRASTDGGSSYGVTTTSSYLQAEHAEDGTGNTRILYNTSFDLNQSTDNQWISNGISNDNDGSGSGHFTLFEPSSTTFAKQYKGSIQQMSGGGVSRNAYVGGYFNTTSAIDAIQFVMTAGTIDSGTISLYGVSTS